jgi:hypothetical protein
MVSDIEKLGAELKPRHFPYGEALHETEIQADQAGTIQNTFAGISELPAWRDREGLRVKPVCRVASARTERIHSEDPVRPLPAGSSQGVIACDHRRKRKARLGGEYTRNLPPAGDGSHQRLRSFQER